MKQIERAKPGPKPELSLGNQTELSRAEAAKQAGMSRHQHNAALNVGSIPEAQFEEIPSSEALNAIRQETGGKTRYLASNISSKPDVDRCHSFLDVTVHLKSNCSPT